VFPTSSPETLAARRAGQAALPWAATLFPGSTFVGYESGPNALLRREPMTSKPWVPFGCGSTKTERELSIAIARGPGVILAVPLEDDEALPRRGAATA
jgi:hypothetical protein